MTEKLKSAFRRFLNDQSGLSAVEYGLLAAGIVAGLYTLLGNIGDDLVTIYTGIDTGLG